MSYTKSLDVVTQYIVDLLTANQVNLSLHGIYYGSRTIIAHFPVVVVDPQNAPKERHATGNIFRRTFTVYIWIAHDRMTQDRSGRTKSNIQLAESVVALLETDYSAGGLLVDSFVQNSEPVLGVISAARQREMVVGTRLTWIGESVA